MPKIKIYPASMHVQSKDSHEERDYTITTKLEVSVPKDMSIDEVVHQIESLINQGRDTERKSMIIEVEVIETSVVY